VADIIVDKLVGDKAVAPRLFGYSIARFQQGSAATRIGMLSATNRITGLA